ncbi:hypothetical protein J057_06951 [Marinobacter nanhaiticus D15-8W]|uniref:Uncharacterized protein n=1 Tax=Marinobacter nanhaiticus D15-8W TaxID=626887 RepID=N6WVK1_9GAMM|nr:hypothetical protein J057_06951 [Marinobacter nanhaiticus D15-8W]
MNTPLMGRIFRRRRDNSTFHPMAGRVIPGLVNPFGRDATAMRMCLKFVDCRPRGRAGAKTTPLEMRGSLLKPG